MVVDSDLVHAHTIVRPPLTLPVAAPPRKQHCISVVIGEHKVMGGLPG